MRENNMTLQHLKGSLKSSKVTILRFPGGGEDIMSLGKRELCLVCLQGRPAGVAFPFLAPSWREPQLAPGPASLRLRNSSLQT